ncbi:MAG: hypothetical protein ACXW30_02555 [Micavibrio sp.]
MSLWPETIDVTKKVIFDEGGMRCESLVQAHEKVENHLEENIFPHSQNKELVDWYRLVDWSVYQLLHGSIRKSKENIINPHKLLSEDRVLRHCLENEEFSADWAE